MVTDKVLKELGGSTDFAAAREQNSQGKEDEKMDGWMNRAYD